VVDHLGHLSILFDPGVACAVVEFLGGREPARAESAAQPERAEAAASSRGNELRVH
jgi:hypothetical protein